MKKRILTLSLLIIALLLTGVMVNAQDPYIVWKVQYYDNPILSDPPTIETTVTDIDFEWFFGSPDPAIPADNFSIRFGTDAFFNAGTYRFTVEADDLVRIAIDENVILDTFGGGQSSNPITRDVPLAGTHHIQIDYREATGVAYLKVDIQNVNDIDTVLPGEAFATVRVATLNVRQQPTTDSPVLTQISFNQRYPVVGSNTGQSWWQIDVNGTPGWVYAPLVTVTTPSAPPVVNAPVTGTTSPTGFNATTQANLRLRAEPRIGNNTLATIPSGTTVPILARNDAAGWFKVNFNGTIGWINYQYIVADPPLRLDQIPVE